MAPVVVAVQALVGALTWSYAYIAATAIGKALLYIGGTILLSKVSAALGPKLPRATSQPIDIEYTDTVAPRRIVYGENKISGMNVLPAIVTGSKGEYLHQVLALTGHEVNAISTVYFNDESITLDGSGNVTSGAYSGKASVRRYTGTTSQTVDAILNAAIPEWDTDHRGRGIAYLALQYTFDQEVYRTGKPDITAIVQGKKCYDPRLDTSPGANPTNAAYAAYTKNPALCLADYLTAAYGLNESASRIDWAAVVTAANICDEDVAIPGSTTQKRYTCNVVLEATAEFENNIKALTQAMMGAAYYSGGKWRMYAGAWSSSAFSLTEDDIIGEVMVQTAQSRKREGYYNAVRGQFVDKDRNYQPVEFEPILNSTYEAEDGERIYTDVSFPTCDNQYEAQRNAIILSRQSRRQKTVQVVCSLAAYKIRPFQTGTVTIAEVGWSNQTVRCIGWKFRPEPAVELTLIEAASTDYSDPSSGTYVTPAAVAVSDPATYAPGSPQSFTATQEIESILLSWQAPSNSVPGILYRVFEYTSATPFSSATQIYEGADTQLRVPRTDTDTRYFWVQSFYGVTGGTSDPTPSGNGLSSSGRPATISGYLTNEVIALEADSSGTVGSYANAFGFFKVFSGSTDVTNLSTFAIVSETDLDGDINTADNTPVSGQVKGYYRVTTLSASSGVLKLSATYGGATITKDFTVTRVQDGSDGLALNIYLTQTGIAIPADSDGANPDFTNASTTVSIYEGQSDVSSSWTVTASPSTGITGSLVTRTYTLTGMTVDTGYVEFTATRSGYDNLVIRLSVTKIKAGAVGPPGPGGDLGGIAAILSRDSAVVMAYSDGTVIDFSPAEGQFSLYIGDENVTGTATFSVTTENCTATVNTATDVPVSGQPRGYYRVTAMSADTATVTITASISQNLGKLLQENSYRILTEDTFFLETEGFFSVSRKFSVAKSKVGYEIVSSLPSTNLFEGRIVFLTTDNKLYRYTGTEWTASVPTTDLTGEIIASQIADAAINTAKFAAGIRPVEIVSSLPAAGTQGRVVFLTTDSKLYRDTGSSWTAAVPTNDLSGTIVESQIADAAINTAKFASGIRPVEIVGSLPTAGTQGRVVFLTTDNKLYRDNGTTWTAAVPTTDLSGTITETQIANAAITTAKFASGIRPVEVLAFLPAAGTQGRTVFLTSDNKLYRDNGTSWVSAVPSTDITGQLSDSQLAAIGAAKITGQITGTQITDGAISTPKLAAGAVTANEIAANTITAAKIAAGTITATELSSGSVTTAKLAAGAVTANEIAANTITAGQIATGAITTDELAANAVTAAKIAAGTITANEIAAATITGSKIAAGTITASNIATDTITAGQIAAGAISTDELAANAVTAAKIAAGTITATQIAAGTITATQIASATITGDRIAGNTITASNIAADTITAGQIASGAISTDELAANAVTAVKIAASTITGNKIAANTITAGNIAAATITATELASNSVTADKINAGAVTAAKISVTELSAISANMGNITAGTIVLPSGGFIRSGQTAYNTGTGFYIGNDAGTPKFSFGSSTGKNIRWDGSDLTVNGGVIVTDSVASNAITASASDTPADVTLTAANSGVDNTLSTVSITTVSGAKVLVRCDLTFKFTLASGSLINIYKIYRGATLIVSIPITSLASGGTYRVPLQWLDSPSSGTNTYYVKVEPTLGGSTTYIYEDIITVATEFKR